MSYAFPREALRSAIKSAIPEQATQYGKTPPAVRFVYAPGRHIQALDPNTMVVEGIRGAGKSFWWATLLSPEHRQALTKLLPQSRWLDDLEVTAGFGTGLGVDEAPSKRVIAELLEKYDPADIWRSVIVWQVLGQEGGVPNDTWLSRVDWVVKNVELVERKLEQADTVLKTRGKTKLVIFDALDTAANNWHDLRRLLRGLLQTALEFRSSRCIRIKAFVRPDMIDNSEVKNFPDASKVLASKAELTWSRANLFGLLWQLVGNADNGANEFRDGCKREFQSAWNQSENVWEVPVRMRMDETLQRQIFDAIAGQWMGADRKRGFPYTWLPNHLSDALGQTSPRSFQKSIRVAAEHDDPHGWEFPLHHAGIRKGVQAASQERVDHVAEDFPWVRVVMEPLRGQITVPCDASDLKAIWEEKEVIKKLGSGVANYRATDTPLGPRSIGRGGDGLIEDLIELGMLLRLPGDRLQMPDVYRIAFGLGRKGGVLPIRLKND